MRCASMDCGTAATTPAARAGASPTCPIRRMADITASLPSSPDDGRRATGAFHPVTLATTIPDLEIPAGAKVRSIDRRVRHRALKAEPCRRSTVWSISPHCQARMNRP
jgi:hypothetical protein